MVLTWDPSPSTNVTGYFVYYGPASGNYTNKMDVSSVTNATIAGLVEGATYYFVVTAYNAAGLESLPSNEVSYTVPPSNAGNEGQIVALPYDLYDSYPYLWDIQPSGLILDGSGDAYDGGHVLSGFPNFTSGLLMGGREMVIGPTNQGGLEITRRIYVPADHAYARFLEVVRNPGGSPVTTTVRVGSNLGSDFSTVVVDTSSGDTVFGTNDNWIVTDDANGSGDPTVLHVIANDSGVIRPSSVFYSTGLLDYQYPVTVPAGETRIVMHFGAQNPDRATALTLGAELTGLGLNALAGISPTDQSRIVNFGLPDALQMTSGEDLVFSGFQGGPFNPSNTVHTLANTGWSKLTWAASSTAEWLVVSPTHGELEPGETTDVTISLTALAASLPSGTNAHGVVFRNLTSGASRTRTMKLVVLPRVLDHFAWYPVAADHYVGETFPVKIRAEDNNGRLLESFTNRIALSGRRDGSSVVFSANFDRGSDNFTYVPDPEASPNLWQRTGHRSGSPTHCQYYGREDSWDYDTGARNAGILQSPAISLAAATAPVTLSFKYLLQTESDTSYDEASVTISADGGTTWTELTSRTNPDNPMVLTSSFSDWTGDISAYAGSNVVVRFRFDTVDEILNTYEGWYVDDVVVTAASTPVTINPTSTGPFTNGEWSGELVVLDAVTNVFLRADDGSGHQGDSNPFNVSAPPRIASRYDAGSKAQEVIWTGTGLELQAQTNSLGVGITTSWFDYLGGTSSPVTIPIDPANPSVFFRLKWPRSAVADFAAGPATGAAPLAVSFTNLSSGAVSYRWDFGDGSTSADPYPAHTYTNAGVYTVSLMASGPGGTNLLVRASYIVARPAVTCRYNAASRTLEVAWAGTGFRLQAQTNSLAVGISTNWFDYPGGTRSPVTIPIDPANPSVFFRLRWPPSAGPDFAAGPTSGAAPLTVCFTNLSSGATRYRWDFGDGNASTDPDPVHTYTNAGVYTVSLTAAGPGDTNTLTRANYIVARPAITWEYNNSEGLQLAWTGTGFHLQAQTNSPGVGITTNWFDCPGGTTSPVTITPDPANASVFYRLVSALNP